MANVSHKDLTGSDLHEPKGAASAAANTHYKADGSGSGSWGKVTSTEIDTSSIFNTNSGNISALYADIGGTTPLYIVVPWACTLDKVYTVLQSSATGADAVLTVANTAGTTIGTITIAFSGSAAGDVDSLTATTNNTFTAGQYVRITSDGGPSNTPAALVVLTFTRSS